MTMVEEDRLYALYDAVRLDLVPDCTVLRFDAVRGTETPIRADVGLVTYAALALRGDDDALRWWITGRKSLNGGSTEDFIAWLIERDVLPSSVVTLR